MRNLSTDGGTGLRACQNQWTQAETPVPPRIYGVPVGQSRLSRVFAFTLVELLTVIAIIGVLAALLFPAIKSSMKKAEITKAQNGVNSLSIALRSYYTEYGHWPIADTPPPPPWFYVVDNNMVALLQGQDIGTAFQPLSEVGGVPPFTAHGNFQGNPRKIVFLQFKQADLGATGSQFPGYYLDPWKKPYYFALDLGYANTVPDPFNTVGSAITNGFLIWSDGPDNQESPTAGDGQGVNADNVKSW